MQQALPARTVVKPGGVVEGTSAELPDGVEVDVIILVARHPERAKTWTERIGSAKGSFTTWQEADAFIRRERDAWDP